MAKKTVRKAKAKRATQSRTRRAPKKAAGKSTRAKTRTKTAARPRPRAAAPSGGLDAIAKRIVAATTSNDEAATLALYADNCESTEMGQPPVTGVDGIKRKFEGWRAMTTNASFTPRTVAVSGNTIVIEWRGTVTLAASGKTVQMDEVAVHEIAGGKIVRERYYYDPSTLRS
jgi:ketosteroid isomerase-like protein